MCFLDSVYKTLIISTIVDCAWTVFDFEVYKTLIISTIVDINTAHVDTHVYKTLIISTIVDTGKSLKHDMQSIRHL